MHKIAALQLHSRNLLAAAISLSTRFVICAESAARERVSNMCLDRGELKTQSGANACT
jgi:NAD(P)H-dependent flavin oxidoreductase YrpB (nitropropane dioxygenase family)